MRRSVLVPYAFLATLIALPAAAQTPSPAPSALPSPAASAASQAARAASDATKAAKLITLESRNGSSMSGTVNLVPIGRTRTRVIVTIPQGGNYALTLHPGTDCNDNRAAAQTAVALAPINSAAPNAPESQTIVELPIDQLQSGNYVVDVRNATEREAVAQACARLSR